jgi:hypothetical protein
MLPNEKVYEKAKLRARQLGVSVGPILDGSVRGSYYYKPLNLAEYCLHEASHLVTLGYRTIEFPKIRRAFGHSLQDEVTSRLSDVSEEASVVLEMDTCQVTYLAGKKLQLWDDHDAIIKSGLKNLPYGGDIEDSFKELFERNEHPQSVGNKYYRMANDVAYWFTNGSR